VTAAELDTGDRLDPALVKLAVIVTLGAIASLLDTTIVNIAIATLSRQFGTPVATIQWVSTGYLLALCAVIPLTGGLIERFGARNLWLFSVGLFLVGSLLCGASWSVPSLIGFRVVQGIGGGMILPVAQTVLAQAAGPRRVGRIMSVVSVPGQLVPILGPAIGGVIVDDLGWRWIFFINAPLCALALVLAWRGMADSGRRPAARLDVTGLILLCTGITLAVYGLSRAGSAGGFGGRMVLASLVAGAMLLAAFVLHALRTRSTPAIDLRLLRYPTFAASSLLMFLFGVFVYGPMLLLPLYFQHVRGLTAFDAGLLMALQGIGAMVALLIAGWLTDRVGPGRVVLTGLVIAVLGTIPLALIGAHTSEVALGISMVVRGLGLGAAAVPAMAASYLQLSADAIPRATSAINLVQRIGGSIGTAAFAVILQLQLADHGGAPAAQAAAFGTAFSWSLALTCLALVPALVLLRSTRAGARRPATETIGPQES
jgi:EmrB/QacA subfamily drug resistance transporter